MRHSLPYRMLRKRPMKLSTTVILMVSAVLFSVLLVVHLIYFSQISDMTRDGLANKALAVARTLADSPTRRKSVRACRKNRRRVESRPSRKPCANATICCLLSLPICKVFATRILKPSVLVSHLKVMTSLKR